MTLKQSDISIENFTKTFTFIDFFAGIGGFRQALEKIGGTCVFSCEIDKKCEVTYKENFNESFNHDDISTLDASKVPYADVICAGFPCQPFSIAGKRSGFNDSRSSVFFDLTRIAEKVKPKILFIENVPNLLKHNNGETFQTISECLKKIGYQTFSQILDSQDFGVPQARKRVYLLAFRNDITVDKFHFSIPKVPIKTVRDIIVPGDNSIPITQKWQDYIDLYTKKKLHSDIDFEIPKTRQKLERIDNNTDLDNCVFQIRSSGIRAISIDKPFPTFAVSVSGGGAMIPVLSSERRHLSVKEITRIMGFRENFLFPVSRTDAIKQLSNSVCPPVIESIGKDFLPYL